MFSLFEFAVGVRLLMFIVFVACVYGGNALFAHLEHRKTKFLWKLAFVTLYSIFLLLVTYVVWLVFYFGLNAQSQLFLQIYRKSTSSWQRGRIFLFSGDILMFTMISRIEYRVKAYMFYPNFLWRSFQFLVHFSIQKKLQFF